MLLHRQHRRAHQIPTTFHVLLQLVAQKFVPQFIVFFTCIVLDASIVVPVSVYHRAVTVVVALCNATVQGKGRLVGHITWDGHLGQLCIYTPEAIPAQWRALQALD